MRCVCCNVALTDYEATRKSVVTNEYFDMCNKCFKTIREDMLYKDNPALLSSTELSELDEDDIYFDDFDNDEY